MKKKLLAIVLSIVMVIGITPSVAFAAYVDKDLVTSEYTVCLDNQTRYISYKTSTIRKDSHLGTDMYGYAFISRNSSTSPTYKEVYAQTHNTESSGGILARTITIKASVSAASININKSLHNDYTVTDYRYKTGTNLGTAWTMFVTSEAIYTNSTVEYYRVNNF